MSIRSRLFLGYVLFILFMNGETIPCPDTYSVILNGCYKIIVNLKLTWSNAKQYCEDDFRKLNLNGTTHLVAFEIPIEKSAVFYWMKAWNIQNEFWIDGQVSTLVWTWSNQPMKEHMFTPNETALIGNGMNYKLSYNSNQSIYQLMDENEFKILPFICEYQMPCNTSQKCQHNGKCFQNVGIEMCVCSPKYTGKNCEIEIMEQTSTFSPSHGSSNVFNIFNILFLFFLTNIFIT
ncbi:hypothetical protein I4U23_005807 [Adineta vaga]|nr:hypothetical protein I4U23_005807 [Adineta vaga]